MAFQQIWHIYDHRDRFIEAYLALLFVTWDEYLN